MGYESGPDTADIKELLREAAGEVALVTASTLHYDDVPALLKTTKALNLLRIKEARIEAALEELTGSGDEDYDVDKAIAILRGESK